MGTTGAPARQPPAARRPENADTAPLPRVVRIMTDTTHGPRTFDDPQVGALVIANAREYAIFLMSEDGVIQSWSPGAELIFGYSTAEAVGRRPDFLFVASDVAANAPDRELGTARAEGRAEDSRWHRRKSGDRFWGNGVLMRIEGDGGGFVKIVRDETRNKLADEQRVLLLNELNHRIKNTLAMVQSIAQQTLRDPAHADARTAFMSRLMALSAAHDVLVRQNWAAADLHTIVEQAIAPHRGECRRCEVDGPPVRVDPQQAVALSLALHELCTNAVKYGALSVPSGKVEISWNLALDGEGRRHMNLLWVESGGPKVAKPVRKGFGTTLLARTFGTDSAGRTVVDFRPEGLRCLIELRLSRSLESPRLGVEDVHGLPVNGADGLEGEDDPLG